MKEREDAMSKVKTAVVKGIRSLALGLKCPKCSNGELHVSLKALLAGTQDESGFCDSCDYVGFQFGGFTKPIVDLVKITFEYEKGSSESNE